MFDVPRRRDLMKAWRLLIPTLILALAACSGSGGPVGDDVVARAAGYDLSAEATAEILAPQPELPNQPEVVGALADLWVQYYLLARATAEDTTLMHLDVGPLVARQVEGELVTGLRDVVIHVDTVVPEDELRRRYEAELPGGQVRARHVLLQFPEGASDAQVDSVRALANTLRERIGGGEAFEEIARQYSADEGTAANGGDLGTFGKNEMVPAFEAAAFSLEVGEISEPVETTFGLHIIRVDERIVPSFEERRESFRIQVQNQIVMEAESTYVAGLVEEAGLETATEDIEPVKQLAADPYMELSSRALSRSLVPYDGGSYTLGEFRDWLLTGQANLPSQLLAAPDGQIENLLQSLARSELLVIEAEEAGLEVSQARRDSITENIINGVKSIAQQLGFTQITPMEGETVEAAADRMVREILVAVVQQGREIFPLQAVAYALREQYGARTYQAGIDRTIALVTEMRAAAPATVTPAAPPPPDTTLPDTAAAGG
jgi:hypothetical protein